MWWMPRVQPKEITLREIVRADERFWIWVRSLPVESRDVETVRYQPRQRKARTMQAGGTQ